MKKGFIMFIAVVIFTLAAHNPSKYIEAMEKGITAMFRAQSTEEYISAANAFERIGNAEENEWHPYYYLALTKILMSTRDVDAEVKDQLLDQAQKAVEMTTNRIAGENSEITALQGFIHMLRIPIDPATRGQQYSGIAMQELSKAVALDPSNPRAYYLLSNMQMGTAQFFGSDLTEACATLEKSITLFTAATEVDHPLDPTWGKEWAERNKSQCE